MDIYILTSPYIAGLLSENLSRDPEVKIVGCGSSIPKAKAFVSGDIVVIGEYPGENLKEMEEFIQCLKKMNKRFVGLCQNAADGFAALAKGASDMVLFSDLFSGGAIRPFGASLLNRLSQLSQNPISASAPRVLKKQGTSLDCFNKVIAIGSSAGGTEAVLEVMAQLPEDCPPVLVVQHMPPVFTRLYADRLNKNSLLSCWEARNGDKLVKGLALLAPGGMQMVLHRGGDGYYVEIFEDKESLYHPSVDILFHSVAKAAGKAAIGVILTGMGSDGADGLLAMRQKGAFTIGQDQGTSAVYGMPKKAYEIGGVCVQAPIGKIAALIKEYI